MTDSDDLLDFLFEISSLISTINSLLHKHHEMTAYIAAHISTSLELPNNKTRDIFVAALIHDIGFIVEKEYYKKSSLIDINLNHPEHASNGAALLKTYPLFIKVAHLVEKHHIAWCKITSNTTLAPPETNIITLADWVAAKYQKNNFNANQAFIDDCLNELQRLSGTYFNPQYIDAFAAVSRNAHFWTNLHPDVINQTLSDSSPLNNEQISLIDKYDIYKSISAELSKKI